jgi:pimeloyl-ACP methyl ester carboxylesterase
MIKTIFLLLATICFVSSTESSSYLTRDVSFQNGSVHLSGTIISPATPGTHPAVVFLHGSGCTPQSISIPIAEKFAEIGVASLIFNKRGCGNSTGSWIDSSLKDLAEDAIAALEFCKTQKEVNPKKIGFWAVSQSGWVAPLAISMTPDVSFLIVVSGGGARPEVTERYAYRNSLQEHGFSEDDQKQVSQLLDLYFQYLRDGKNHDELMNAIAEARNRPWYSQVQLDKILPTEEARLKWQWVAAFDPQPYEEEIHCPVLLFFGGKDPFQPADAAASAWKTALEKAGNSNYTIKVYPEAGHAMTLGPHHPGNQTYVNGYIDAMLQWLAANAL